MKCSRQTEAALAVGVLTALCTMVSSETGPKSHFPPPSSGNHPGHRNGNPVSHSFTYQNFGNRNNHPVLNERSSKGGHNLNGDKLTTRDTTSSFSQSSSQQPDPSIALLPRGDQEGSLYSKETGSGSPFSGSSTSETTGFGGSQLGGYQQGIQLPGFPSTFGGFSFTPSGSPSSSQGSAIGRNPQGSSIARFPQSFPLGGFTYGSALTGFPQGLAVAGFPQGATFGGFPQGATYGAFAPGLTLGGFPYGAALSPVPGPFAAGGPALKGQPQQSPVPVRGSPYAFASPAGFQLYNQVPAQGYQTSNQK